MRPFPNVDDDLHLVSTEGGRKPLCSRSGDELFYIGVAGEKFRMMSVPVEIGDAFRSGTPEVLMPWPYKYGNERRMNVVLNLTEELNALVPAP